MNNHVPANNLAKRGAIQLMIVAYYRNQPSVQGDDDVPVCVHRFDALRDHLGEERESIYVLQTRLYNGPNAFRTEM